MKREPGNYQLFQEEIEPHIKLVSVRHGREYECEHMMPPISKYEIGYIGRTSGRVCQFAMCCDCYQKLRGLGLAPLKGTWESDLTP